MVDITTVIIATRCMILEIEVRRDGVVICVWKDELCANEPRIIKDMKANGYKFYQNGKIYKL